MAYSRDLPKMAINGLSWTIMDYHGLAWTITDYHGLSWSPGLSWTIMDYHGLSWTILDYFRLLFLHIDQLQTDLHWYLLSC